jgi:hypothetical protein
MKVFIAGPRAISNLNSEVLKRIDNIINNGFTILIGDASGIDKAVQNYCTEKQYSNVQVFASNGKARNNIGQWEVVKIEIENNIKGFDFYAAKDLAMAKEADYGFMIWNGKSKGTLNNIINLTLLDKKVLVYYTPDNKFYVLKSIDAVKEFLSKNDDITVKNFFIEHLSKNDQMTLPI